MLFHPLLFFFFFFYLVFDWNKEETNQSEVLRSIDGVIHSNSILANWPISEANFMKNTYEKHKKGMFR